MFTKQGHPKAWVTINDFEVIHNILYISTTQNVQVMISYDCKQLFPNVTFPAHSH